MSSSNRSLNTLRITLTLRFWILLTFYQNESVVSSKTKTSHCFPKFGWVCPNFNGLGCFNPKHTHVGRRRRKRFLIFSVSQKTCMLLTTKWMFMKTNLVCPNENGLELIHSQYVTFKESQKCVDATNGWCHSKSAQHSWRRLPGIRETIWSAQQTATAPAMTHCDGHTSS